MDNISKNVIGSGASPLFRSVHQPFATTLSREGRQKYSHLTFPASLSRKVFDSVASSFRYRPVAGLNKERLAKSGCKGKCIFRSCNTPLKKVHGVLTDTGSTLPL